MATVSLILDWIDEHYAGFLLAFTSVYAAVLAWVAVEVFAR